MAVFLKYSSSRINGPCPMTNSITAISAVVCKAVAYGKASSLIADEQLTYRPKISRRFFFFSGSSFLRKSKNSSSRKSNIDSTGAPDSHAYTPKLSSKYSNIFASVGCQKVRVDSESCVCSVMTHRRKRGVASTQRERRDVYGWWLAWLA